MAGLLTRFLPESLPIPNTRDSGKDFQRVSKKLTAAGTVRDFHPIPYYGSATEYRFAHHYAAKIEK